MKQRIIIFTICLLATLKMMAQEFTLQGRVMDDDNNPVELVTVSVLSQGKVAFTSLKGEFSMRLHSADSVAVKFSMIGYKSKTRVLRRPRGKQTLQIVLHADATMLGEVNVTARKSRPTRPRKSRSRISRWLLRLAETPWRVSSSNRQA